MAEIQELRASANEMQAVIQIQAQIDAALIEDREDGLLAARLEAGARGHPDQHLVNQAIQLLRMRRRILKVRKTKWDRSTSFAARESQPTVRIARCPSW